MPGTAAPIADLGHALRALLLTGLIWVAGCAVVVGVAFWVMTRRGGPVPSRLHRNVVGTAPVAEPLPRRYLRIAFGLLWIVDGLLQAQPKMPGGFIPTVVEPGVTTAPGWFGDLVAPLARAWQRHPVTADAATVWVQVGLGALLLIGGAALLARLALWASIAWSAAVWVIGEAFGGLFATGASWLSGAPGAVLVYAAAGLLLLAPWQWWQSGRAQSIARRFVAGWLVFGAVLQALPGERQWRADGISEMFSAGATRSQPDVLARPIARVAGAVADNPHAANATVIVLLVLVAAALWFSGRAAAVVLGMALCAATWWLAQDFGILGGTATDPNTALPLAVLLGAALPALSQAAEPAASTSPAVAPMRWARSTAVAFAVGLTLVAPLVAASTLGQPADANAVAADSDGGLRRIPDRPAPPFALTDQRGRAVSMQSLRGKLVVLTFLDPVCTSDCPLVANQLAIADQGLGALAERVEIVAIDTNPLFHLQSDVAAFTDSHGLAELPNWHFLYGPPETVQDVLAKYGISVEVPAVGMIQHSEGVFFITPDGRQAAYFDDHADVELTVTYADQVRGEIRSLLK